ncbi:MAG: AzlC family ABC transporter permease [Ruminococcaceae bacterium]|nr:AzlC family ABC transporter permease [Oscillospiraceae bacterium]
MQNKIWYRQGLRDGIPIALGYFAVAFALGIAAKSTAKLNVIQATLASFLLNASAGEHAGFTQIGEDAPYFIAALFVLVANARYLLMSCALSQKLAPETPLIHRMLVAFDVTDEIFAISVAVKGKLNPFYNYGAMTVAIPGWAGGTALGVLMGDILPDNVVSALGVGLYGMFIAIIIPPARKNRIIAGLVIISMAASFIFTKLEIFSGIDSGIKIIILTVVISLVAAILFPVKELKEEKEETHAQ